MLPSNHDLKIGARGENELPAVAGLWRGAIRDLRGETNRDTNIRIEDIRHLYLFN